MATGDHTNVIRLTYWDGFGNEHWLSFGFPERATGDQLMEQLQRRVPELWFDWRVSIEASKRVPVESLGREHAE